MIRVNQVKLPVSHSEADLRKKTAKMMGVSADQIQSVELVRQSLDMEAVYKIMEEYES